MDWTTTCSARWSLFPSMIWRLWLTLLSCWSTRRKLRMITARGRHLLKEDPVHQDLAPLLMRDHHLSEHLAMHPGHSTAMLRGRVTSPLALHIRQGPIMEATLGSTMEAARAVTLVALEEMAPPSPVWSGPTMALLLAQNLLEAASCAGRRDTSPASAPPRLLLLHNPHPPR